MGELVFVEIFWWKLGFPHKVQAQALFFFLQYIVKNKIVHLSPHTQEKTCCNYYKNNYWFRFGLGTNFLFLNQYTQNKHALSLLIKRDYLQHDWPKTSTKDIKAPEKSLAESYRHKMKWKLQLINLISKLQGFELLFFQEFCTLKQTFSSKLWDFCLNSPNSS